MNTRKSAEPSCGEAVQRPKRRSVRPVFENNMNFPDYKYLLFFTGSPNRTAEPNTTHNE
ncbi:MAG: hypothetical protein JW764_08640 [Chlorobiaceae bacterium]|nr:hypothetical protein [Chlorobiaceae bacterium]